MCAILCLFDTLSFFDALSFDGFFGPIYEEEKTHIKLGLRTSVYKETKSKELPKFLSRHKKRSNFDLIKH
jgi:hypothetical protein